VEIKENSIILKGNSIYAAAMTEAFKKSNNLLFKFKYSGDLSWIYIGIIAD